MTGSFFQKLSAIIPNRYSKSASYFFLIALLKTLAKSVIVILVAISNLEEILK